MPAQHLCGGLRWLTEDATDQLFAHAQPRQVVIAPDMLSAALCMPKLVARLAVSEAAPATPAWLPERGAARSCTAGQLGSPKTCPDGPA